MGLVGPPDMTKVLLTGSSGFLGRHIIQEMCQDFSLITLAHSDADICVDLSADTFFELPVVDMVIHAAGLAHLVNFKPSSVDPFDLVNVSGTTRLLDAIKASGKLPRSFVFISSVAVYGKEEGQQYDEDTPLGALDPYGVSKIKAERVVIDWCESNSVSYLILRLPLLVGNNPPGNLGHMIDAIKRDRFFTVGNGAAKKSMVMATDVAKCIATSYHKTGIFNLTDGYHPSMGELSCHIALQLGKKRPLRLPYFFVKLGAFLGDLLGDRFPINSRRLVKLMTTLTFDDAKARRELEWSPTKVLQAFKPTTR